MDTGSDYFKWDGVAEKIVGERNVNTDMLLILTVWRVEKFWQVLGAHSVGSESGRPGTTKI